MRRSSLANQHTALFAAAAIGAHANSADGGFRHKQVKFLLELCANWLEEGVNSTQISIQNIQIKRFLSSLVNEGYARVLPAKQSSRGPLYRLTRLGLVHLLSLITDRSTKRSSSDLLFSLYFIKSYRERLLGLVREEGRQFPYAVQVEIEELLNPKRLLEGEINRVMRDKRTLENRIADSQQALQMIKSERRRGTPLKEIFTLWESKWPYAFNSQQPLGTLLGSLDPTLAKIEVDYGHENRLKVLWETSLVQINQYLALLRGMVT